jgi:hypothetical protein
MTRLSPLLLVAACTTEADCLGWVDDAHRVAAADAPSCRFAPDALDRPTCSTLDRRPLQTYLAVYCGSAPVACLRDDEAAWRACFGGPSTPGDTGPGEGA